MTRSSANFRRCAWLLNGIAHSTPSHYNRPVHYVYIVQCVDGTLYTGYAVNVDKRIVAHNAGRGAKYTASRLPVSLVYSESFESKSDALKREHQLKRLTRAEKHALISGDGS